MPSIREFIDQFITIFNAARDTARSNVVGKKKKEKQPQTFRGGGRGTVDLNNYDPKDANKNAQRGGSAAALQNMDLTANLKAKIDKLKKKDPPKLAGRSSSCLAAKPVGVTPKQTLRKTLKF